MEERNVTWKLYSQLREKRSCLRWRNEKVDPALHFFLSMIWRQIRAPHVHLCFLIRCKKRHQRCSPEASEMGIISCRDKLEIRGVILKHSYITSPTPYLFLLPRSSWYPGALKKQFRYQVRWVRRNPELRDWAHRAKSSRRKAGVLLHTQDPGVTTVCPEHPDLFAHNLQPQTPKSTQWGMSPGWAWRAWSWWSLECCCLKLGTVRKGPTVQPGREHRDIPPFSKVQPWQWIWWYQHVLERNLRIEWGSCLLRISKV